MLFVGLTGLGFVLFAGTFDAFWLILAGVSTLVGVAGASFLGVSSLKAQTRLIAPMTKIPNATNTIAMFWYAKANMITSTPTASNNMLNTVSSELDIIDTYNL